MWPSATWCSSCSTSITRSWSAGHFSATNCRIEQQPRAPAHRHRRGGHGVGRLDVEQVQQARERGLRHRERRRRCAPPARRCRSGRSWRRSPGAGAGRPQVEGLAVDRRPDDRVGVAQEQRRRAGAPGSPASGAGCAASARSSSLGRQEEAERAAARPRRAAPPTTRSRSSSATASIGRRARLRVRTGPCAPLLRRFRLRVDQRASAQALVAPASGSGVPSATAPRVGCRCDSGSSARTTSSRQTKRRPAPSAIARPPVAPASARARARGEAQRRARRRAHVARQLLGASAVSRRLPLAGVAAGTGAATPRRARSAGRRRTPAFSTSASVRKMLPSWTSSASPRARRVDALGRARSTAACRRATRAIECFFCAHIAATFAIGSASSSYAGAFRRVALGRQRQHVPREQVAARHRQQRERLRDQRRQLGLVDALAVVAQRRARRARPDRAATGCGASARPRPRPPPARRRGGSP